MSKRKFKQGKAVTSLDELYEHKFFIAHGGKRYCASWCVSWPVRSVKEMIDRRLLFVAERLTNQEYYSGKSYEKIQKMLGDKLCDYCHVLGGRSCVLHRSGKSVMCNERHCQDALENWKKEEVR